MRLVFLSATILNSREFAEWIAKIKNQICNVVLTEMRPVPLQHYVHVEGSDGIHLVIDAKGQFRENNFNTAMEYLALDQKDVEVRDILNSRGDDKKKPTTSSSLKNVIKLIAKNQLSPCIIFSFSKREVESNALTQASMDLTTEEEKKSIEEVYKNAISTLNDDDQNLPMVVNILSIIKRGIAIHHGGLLPIIKEVILKINIS